MYNGMLTKHKVLIVDDESSILMVFKQALSKQFHVDTAESGEAGLDMINKQGPYGVVISDLRMPGMDGMQFISQDRRAAPESEFIIQTGYAERETVTKAVTELGVSRILVKPCDAKTLIQEAHTGLGGVLLRHWRFPKEFISVATLHEDPMAFPHVAKSVLVTHIANILTRKIGYSLFEEDVDLGSLEAAKRLNISEESLEVIGQEIVGLMQEETAAF
jgi:CheY-like chemotaxis protein